MREKRERKKREKCEDVQKRKYAPPTMGDPNDPIVISVFLTFSPHIAERVRQNQNQQKKINSQIRQKNQSNNNDEGVNQSS